MLTIRQLRDRAVIRPVKRAVEDELFDLPGVTAVDLGEKRRAGRGTGQQAIVVSVEHKRSRGQVPPDQHVPASVDGVVTDVVEEEPVLWHIHCQQHQALAGPPARPGAFSTSTGGPGITPARTARMGRPHVPTEDEYHRIGTLGPLVTSGAATLALTTFDVACLDDAWSIGDRMVEPVRGNAYAELERAALSARVDAAAVVFDGEVGAVPRNVDGAAVGAGGTAFARPGTWVCKLGFGTGLTCGVVSSVDVSMRVDHGDALGVRVLREQLRVSGCGALFCGAGDAGAAVIDRAGRVVGLHVAGGSAGRVGFASPIADVLDELDVRLCVYEQRVLA